MTIPEAITAVVRYAVETAQVEWTNHENERRLSHVHLSVTARSRIQDAATTTERLVMLAEACDEEVRH